MKLIAATIATLAPLLAFAQPLPQSWTGGSPPHGWSRSGDFIVPREGVQEAIPAAGERDVSLVLDTQRSYCLRSSVGR
jgi:hypothetical protein